MECEYPTNKKGMHVSLGFDARQELNKSIRTAQLEIPSRPSFSNLNSSEEAERWRETRDKAIDVIATAERNYLADLDAARTRSNMGYLVYCDALTDARLAFGRLRNQVKEDFRTF